MNENDQRIAIAEACGWTITESIQGIPYGYHKEWSQEDRSTFPPALTPDYLHDLNAMHDALKAMTPAEWMIFMDFLCIVTGHDKTVAWFYKQSGVVIEMFKATAAHRAEAFLRTIGKWRDDPLPAPAPSTSKP